MTTSSLILPAHLQAKLEKENVSRETSAPGALETAFVPEAERVFDPTKLPDTALARLPQPTGWRLLVLPYRGRAMSKGGILYADQTVEQNSLVTVVAYVLAVGPDAYCDKTKFLNGPWCKKGDWVIIGRYAGARFKIEGGEVRIINDDEIIATIADPSDVSNV
jgi:co-chaperonin GroES (HSP10)